MQCRLAAFSSSVDVGTLVKQTLDSGSMTPLCRIVQCRLAAIGNSDGVGASVEQELEGFVMSLLCRTVQCCLAIFSSSVDVCVCVKSIYITQLHPARMGYGSC